MATVARNRSDAVRAAAFGVMAEHRGQMQQGEAEDDRADQLVQPIQAQPCEQADALQQQLRKEEEELRATKESVHRMEEEILKRLWNIGRSGPEV